MLQIIKASMYETMLYSLHNNYRFKDIYYILTRTRTSLEDNLHTNIWCNQVVHGHF